MAFRSLVFVSFLLTIMVAQNVEVQPGLPPAPQIGLPPGRYFAVRINGTVYCTANSNIGPNGAATPPFPGKFFHFIDRKH